MEKNYYFKLLTTPSRWAWTVLRIKEWAVICALSFILVPIWGIHPLLPVWAYVLMYIGMFFKSDIKDHQYLYDDNVRIVRLYRLSTQTPGKALAVITVKDDVKSQTTLKEIIVVRALKNGFIGKESKEENYRYYGKKYFFDSILGTPLDENFNAFSQTGKIVILTKEDVFSLPCKQCFISENVEAGTNSQWEDGTYCDLQTYEELDECALTQMWVREDDSDYLYLLVEHPGICGDYTLIEILTAKKQAVHAHQVRNVNEICVQTASGTTHKYFYNNKNLCYRRADT